MTNKTTIYAFILILIMGMLSSCKKVNNDNNNEEPITPDTPVITFQIPPIDEYMPERLLQLFDSLNVLHRGDTPPTIAGNFTTESLNCLIVDKVAGSPYIASPGAIIGPYYFEMREQGNDTLGIAFKKTIGSPEDPFFFLEKSDTDSTYYRIKDNTALFTDDPIAPPYFKSSKFTAEDFRHAYVIGNDNYFTLYFYEIRDISNNALPLNAILISGKMAKDTEGNPIIEDFWCGCETMKYYNDSESLNLIIQFGMLPTPGDIFIMQSPNTLLQGIYNYK